MLKMLNVPHFGHSPQVTAVVKQLLALVHDGNLWIGNQRIAIDGELIYRIIGLQKEGPDPGLNLLESTKIRSWRNTLRTSSV